MTKSIGEVTLPSGTIDPRKNPDQLFKYVDVSGVSNRTFAIVDVAEISGHDAPSRARRLIKAGDILFATIRPTLQRIALVPDELDGEVCSTGYFVFRTKPELESKFLYYYLFTDSFMDAMQALQTGASYPAVNDSQVKQQQVPLPPLPVQKRIVAILDEAFAGIGQAIANTERNLKNARELFESYLNDVFTRKGDGWQPFRVEEVCSSIVDCINKTAPQVEEETPFKMIRTTNVRHGYVNIDTVKYVTEETYDAWTRRQIPLYGDVILTREAPLGEVGVLLSDEKVFLGQRLVAYRANPEVLNNMFLLYAFQSSDVQLQMQSLASGSTVQHMRVPDTKNLTVNLPSITEQNKLVDQLEAMKQNRQHLEAIYQQKLKALTELKQSILQKAFTGALTDNLPL